MLRTLKKHKTQVFIVLSILLHLLILSSQGLKDLFFPQTVKKSEELLEVVFLPQEKEKMQVVDRLQDANEKESPDSQYLSNKNNVVEEETKSRPAPITENKVAEKKNEKKKKSQEQVSEDEILASDTSLTNIPNLSQLKVKLEDMERISRNLKPPETSDYLPNVLEKDRTVLNTKEFMFFSYYERIKKRVGMFWTPALEKKYRKMYYANISLDDRDLTTKLIIVLDGEGNIDRIENF